MHLKVWRQFGLLPSFAIDCSTDRKREREEEKEESTTSED